MEAKYIGINRQFFDTIDSTNNYASSQAGKTGIPEGTLVWAGFQSAGRGQAGNRWESKPGENLTFSLILYPRFLSPERQFLVSETVSLAITDFLELYTGDSAIKWPNDIFTGKGKIGGILIEHAIVGQIIAHTIAGIGINLNQKEFSKDAPGAVSLRQLTGEKYEPEACLDLFCSFLEKRYDSLKKGSFEKIESDYFSKLLGKDTLNLYRDQSGEFFARINHIEASGVMVLETDKGELRSYGFREVELLEPGQG